MQQQVVLTIAHTIIFCVCGGAHLGSMLHKPNDSVQCQQLCHVCCNKMGITCTKSYSCGAMFAHTGQQLWVSVGCSVCTQLVHKSHNIVHAPSHIWISLLQKVQPSMQVSEAKEPASLAMSIICLASLLYIFIPPTFFAFYSF